MQPCSWPGGRSGKTLKMGRSKVKWLDPSNRRTLQPALRQLAIETSQRILPYQQTRLKVTQKNDNTPVTEADLAAHQLITERLAQLTPDIPCLSEESTPEAIRDRHNWKIYWLIDPLDGTREFIDGGEAFTINIALIIDHRPVIGLIHLPVTGETWYAHHGDGSLYFDADDQQHTIQTRSLPTLPVVAIGHRRHRERLHAFLEELGPHQTIQRASSLKSCLVASALADIYPCFGPTSEWDTAAAQCIVEQAGGRIIDLTMQPLRYNLRDTLENPPFIVIGDPTNNWSSVIAGMTDQSSQGSS